MTYDDEMTSNELKIRNATLEKVYKQFPYLKSCDDCILHHSFYVAIKLGLEQFAKACDELIQIPKEIRDAYFH